MLIPSMIYAVAGGLLGAVLALIPALHVYNVAGLILLATYRGVNWAAPEAVTLFMMGMLVSYAVMNTIPAIFFSVPDDSMLFVVLPGQKYLMESRGYEAAVLIGAGALGALMLVVIFALLAPGWLPPIRRILQPHLGWILLATTLYMLLSEWPKGAGRGRTRWERLREAWSGLSAGLLAFLLSGLLGMVLFYRQLIPVEVAYQNLLPAFSGLFAIPWLMLNLVSRQRIPSQHLANTVDLTPGVWARGVVAGLAGGTFAAFFPAVTGGIGAFLAGQATAQRDDRLFLVSQGASKVVYYVGGFLLFFVPDLHLTRGGMAGMIAPIYFPYEPAGYPRAIAIVALIGALAFALLLFAARLAARLVSRFDTRWLSGGTLILVAGIVSGLTGWQGAAIMVIATCIGLIPVMWGSRRMNCMGVLLMPLTLNLLGAGPVVANWLGLV